MSIVRELRASIIGIKIECITCKISRTKFDLSHEKKKTETKKSSINFKI